MLTKKVICLILCLALLIYVSGCKKVEDAFSSINSDFSSISEQLSSTESNSSESSTPLTEDGASQNNTSSTSDTTSKKDYGFTKLTNVEYECLKDVPGGDAQYEVTYVKTDTSNAFIYAIMLSCDDKSITIKDRTVTIPFEYRQKHDSVTITATHSLAKVSIDFTITFDKWDLIFQDEFNGTELNTEVWDVWDQKRDWRYSYSKDNLFLDGKGNLVNRMSIVADPTAENGESRLSGAMTTDDRFETTYGYFEVRLKPHFAPGLMGAFWLMAGDMGDKNAADDNTAVNGCEIDIIETFYHNLNPAQTIHWDGYTHTKSKGFSKPGSSEIFDGNYHTFGLLWTPDEYVFLIDGEVNERTDSMGICNQPGYLLISSHFNNDAGEFPYGVGGYTDMLVDYVRVYKTDKLK